MKGKFIVSVVILCVITGFNCVASADQLVARKNIIHYFGVIEKAQYKNFDSLDFHLSRIIKICQHQEYWDLCLKALTDLAYVADKYYRLQTQEEVVSSGFQIIAKYRESLAKLDADYEIRGSFYLVSGIYYRNKGEYNKALTVFQTIVQKFNNNEILDRKMIFNTYAYIADLYMKMGLYDKVYEYYSLTAKSIPDDQEFQPVYRYLQKLYMGSYFYRIKNYQLSKKYYQLALNSKPKQCLKNPWKGYLISNYNILGLIYQKLGDYDSTFLCLDKSIRLQKEDDAGLLDTYEYYGDCLFNFKEYDSAIEFYQKIYDKLNISDNLHEYKKVRILTKIGSVYQHQQNFFKAVKMYQHALSLIYKDHSYESNVYKNPVLQSIQADKSIIKLFILKSNALYGLAGNVSQPEVFIKESLKTYFLASKIIDDFRHQISNDDFKEFFVNDVRDMYENAVKACFSSYKISKKDTLLSLAFFFMEKSKNQVLIDALQTNNAKRYSKIPDALIQKDEFLKNGIIELQNKLYKLKYSDAASQIIENCQYDYLKSVQTYTAFVKGLENKYPDYYKLKHNTQVIPLQVARKYIHEDLFIEYLVGADYIHILAYNKGKAIFKQIPTDSSFHKLLYEFISSIPSACEISFSRNYFRNFVKQSNTIYRTLLKPVLDEFTRAEKILIIPDNILCAIPFDLLIKNLPADSTRIDYRNLDYIIKKYSIRYEYSSDLAFDSYLHKTRRVFKNDYIGFAPFYNGNGYNLLQRSSQDDNHLAPLEFSKLEISNSASLFGGKTFIGKEATEWNLKNAVSSTRILHIAAHTLINDSIPDLSGIFLSSEDTNRQDNRKNEDNILYVNEIYNTKLNADLVILSACETGMGKLMEGEGIISLGRAFKYAGCSGIVMSLWNANDYSTARIMYNFCKELKKGERKDAALRNAKLEYLNKSKAAGNFHPFYWATFVLIGNDEPFSNTGNMFIPILIAVLFVTILTIWLLKKRSKSG